jgi:hypothetical protein
MTMKFTPKSIGPLAVPVLLPLAVRGSSVKLLKKTCGSVR